TGSAAAIAAARLRCLDWIEDDRQSATAASDANATPAYSAGTIQSDSRPDNGTNPIAAAANAERGTAASMTPSARLATIAALKPAADVSQNVFHALVPPGLAASGWN